MQKTSRAIAIALLLAVCLVIVCVAHAELVMYQNPTNGYQIGYPEDGLY